jgi:hypothetical protein
MKTINIYRFDKYFRNLNSFGEDFYFCWEGLEKMGWNFVVLDRFCFLLYKFSK